MCKNKPECDGRKTHAIDPRVSRMIGDYSDLFMKIGQEAHTKLGKIYAKKIEDQNPEDIIEVCADLALMAKFMEEGKEMMLESSANPRSKTFTELLFKVAETTQAQLEELDAEFYT